MVIVNKHELDDLFDELSRRYPQVLNKRVDAWLKSTVRNSLIKDKGITHQVVGVTMDFPWHPDSYQEGRLLWFTFDYVTNELEPVEARIGPMQSFTYMGKSVPKHHSIKVQYSADSDFVKYDLHKQRDASYAGMRVLSIQHANTIVSHILDWLPHATDLPNDLSRLSAKDAINKTVAWHELRTREQTMDKRIDNNNKGNRHTMGEFNGWKFEHLLDKQALVHESAMMGHCVGWETQNYIQRTEDKESTILHVSKEVDDVLLHYTVELSRSLSILQAQNDKRQHTTYKHWTEIEAGINHFEDYLTNYF